MSRPPVPLFLARQSYRHRRLSDAARILPVLGLILFFLPIAWSRDASTSAGLIYIFGIWACLIAVVAGISGRLSKSQPEDQNETTSSEEV